MKSTKWLPYVAPFAVYLALLTARSPENIIWMYPLTTVLVGATLWAFRKQYEELHSPLWGAARQAHGAPAVTWLLAVVVGLVVAAMWIGVDPYYPKFETAEIFDPTGQRVFIAFRVLGAVIVVPLMEELFWRAFLIRWLVNESNFKQVAVGTFTWSSFAIATALFGVEHREWLAGLICGALYNWLLYARRDVFACTVAHAVSNATLAAWVLTYRDWHFW